MQKIFPLTLEYCDYVLGRQAGNYALALCADGVRNLWYIPDSAHDIEVVLSDEYMPRSYKVRLHKSFLASLDVQYSGKWWKLRVYLKARQIVREMLTETDAKHLYVKIRY